MRRIKHPHRRGQYEPDDGELTREQLMAIETLEPPSRMSVSASLFETDATWWGCRMTITVYQLQRNPKRLIAWVNRVRKPLFITHRGRIVAVLRDVITHRQERRVFKSLVGTLQNRGHG